MNEVGDIIGNGGWMLSMVGEKYQTRRWLLGQGPLWTGHRSPLFIIFPIVSIEASTSNQSKSKLHCGDRVTTLAVVSITLPVKR